MDEEWGDRGMDERCRGSCFLKLAAREEKREEGEEDDDEDEEERGREGEGEREREGGERGGRERE